MRTHRNFHSVHRPAPQGVLRSDSNGHHLPPPPRGPPRPNIYAPKKLTINHFYCAGRLGGAE